jgi:hypothetical protein
VRAALALIAVAGVPAGCGAGEHATTALVSTTRPRPPAFHVSLMAPTHTPRVGKSKWWYVVRATAAGKPVHGKLTVEVVDPLGTAHFAQVGTTTRKLRDYPFAGRYRDFAQWPAASRGYRLTFRVTVAARGASRTVDYWVRPR